MIRSFLRRDAVRRDLRTAVVAVFVASLVMATPSVAGKITNADKVDGKDAVSAGASLKARKGKLVATDGKGVLPNNILKKAKDADRIDGYDSGALLTKVARRGSVQTGDYAARGGGTGEVNDTVQFRSALPVRLESSRVTFIATGGAPTAECPGEGQVIPKGWLCVYELFSGNRAQIGPSIWQPDTASGFFGATEDGFGVVFTCSAAPCRSFGTWAVRAGNQDDVVAKTSGPRRSSVARH